ncbi:MAG: hypothetical protein IT258_02460 [Saprospiraceae bacterium]|nr:hypothetical protein [Saprospiraceae bacterium]
MQKLFFLSLFTALLLVGYKSNGQASKINGRLKVENKIDKKNIVENSTMVILTGDSIQKVTNVDENLCFSFDSLTSGKYSIQVKTIFYYQDTIVRNIVLKIDEVIKVKIPYPPFCIYRNKKGKVCPICHKEDEVIPVVYGLLVFDPEAPEKDEEEFYSGGCMVTGCDPKWYCKRDKKEF